MTSCSAGRSARTARSPVTPARGPAASTRTSTATSRPDPGARSGSPIAGRPGRPDQPRTTVEVPYRSATIALIPAGKFAADARWSAVSASWAVGVAGERGRALLGPGVGQREDRARAAERAGERQQRRRPRVEVTVPCGQLGEQPLRVAAGVLGPDHRQLRQHLDRDARRRHRREVVRQQRQVAGRRGHLGVVRPHVGGAPRGQHQRRVGAAVPGRGGAPGRLPGPGPAGARPAPGRRRPGTGPRRAAAAARRPRGCRPRRSSRTRRPRSRRRRRGARPGRRCPSRRAPSCRRRGSRARPRCR